MLALLALVAASAEPVPVPVPVDGLRPPLRPVPHAVGGPPTYVDSAGHAVAWSEIRALSQPTHALGKVRSRQAGRMVLRVLFAAATVAEAYGTVALIERQNWLAVPLGVQTGFTAAGEVLLWTAIPANRVEDRAIVLAGANDVLRGPLR